MKYRRKCQIRIPRKIFIFTEGEIKEQNYFKHFIAYFGISEARVQVIKRDSSHSDPQAVLDFVNEFKLKIKKNERDISQNYEYWLVLDTDRWGANLTMAIKDASNRKYELAVSNPCFEIWLLLHYRDANYVTGNANNLNTKGNINTNISGFNLTGKNEIDFFPKTPDAVQNAKGLDIQPQLRQFSYIGTRVYKLVELLLEYK